MNTKDLGFDEKEYMMKIHTGSAQDMYHTKLYDRDVHQISTSSQYASGIMINDKNYELGEKIFRKVISLQDVNPESETYGLWPWYMEETLEEMDAPDYNMADFNAKEMEAVLFEESENLSPEFKELLFESIERACRCIIKRDMGPHYTNVCITDCFVTAAAGELCNSAELLNYGKNKMKRFIDFTNENGDVMEFNSPTYTILAVNDMGDFFRYLKNEEVLKYAEEINRLLWKMLAEHFDYRTLQLNGPQDRAYSDFVGVEFLKTIGNAAGIDYTAHPKFDKYFNEEQKESYYKPARHYPVCPPEYIPYFRGEKTFKELHGTILKDKDFDGPRAAYVYNGDGYAVGTYNKSELWNQRRPFLGYICCDGRDVSFRVKCYHDGYDFSSADIYSVQDKGNVLSCLHFSSDRGDTHCCLDNISNGEVSAEDLRITFELSGGIENIKYSRENGMLLLDVNGVKIRVNPFICKFGDTNIEECIETADDVFRYSLILYKGERRTLHLCDADMAFAAFTAEFGYDGDYTAPEYTFDGDFADLSWKPGDRLLGLRAITKADGFRRNFFENEQLIDGKNIFDKQ